MGNVSNGAVESVRNGVIESEKNTPYPKSLGKFLFYHNI